MKRIMTVLVIAVSLGYCELALAAEEQKAEGFGNGIKLHARIAPDRKRS